MNKDLYEGLTEEQIAKVKSCKNIKEILSYARKEGIELNDEQLAFVCGGGCGGENRETIICPLCHAHSLEDIEIVLNFEAGLYDCTCKKCGHKWTTQF